MTTGHYRLLLNHCFDLVEFCLPNETDVTQTEGKLIIMCRMNGFQFVHETQKNTAFTMCVRVHTGCNVSELCDPRFM